MSRLNAFSLRLIALSAVLTACIFAAGCAESEPGNEAQIADSGQACNDGAASEVIEGFGLRLKSVSLAAPDSLARRQIEEAYAPYVTSSLLDTWVSEPGTAPGRLTSSPWPERIEIHSIEAGADGTCVVNGEVIYVTSVEVANGGAAMRTPVTLRLRKDDAWQISEYEAGASSKQDSLSTSDEERSAVAAGAPEEVIREYYEAINARDLRRAFSLWGSDGAASGQSFEEFAAGFAETQDVTVEIGDPGRIEPAAGSRYVDVAVVIRAMTRDGEVQRFEGTYTLRRSVVDGATAAQRRWHIYSADLAETS